MHGAFFYNVICKKLPFQGGYLVVLGGWVILNFYTALVLILLLFFQMKNTLTLSSKRFINLDIMTLILLAAETIGHFGELHPDNFLFLAKIGYYIIYALDPADYLFAILYIDCWINDDNRYAGRRLFTGAYKIFVAVNFLMVTVSTIFDLKLFYYFEGQTYYRGSLFMVRAILLLAFCLFLTVYSVIYRKRIYADYRTAIFALPTLAMIGAFLQIIFVDLDMTYASIAVGLLILFCGLQANDLDIDYLTGTLNRRGLDIKMEEHVRTAQNGGKSFSAIMLDLDRFKSINDTYGHMEGDYALKTVSEILFRVFNKGAYIGRYGGDEFCVISNVTDQAALDESVDILNDELEIWNYRGGKPYQLEVSVGKLIYDPFTNMGPKEFQIAIDEQMYKEKRKHHLKDNRRSARDEA